jgi:hypothetical protein
VHEHILLDRSTGFYDGMAAMGLATLSPLSGNNGEHFEIRRFFVPVCVPTGSFDIDFDS